mmetsp:Transcript_16621/g.47865  ORF Transcript_16621/g.47865 Transcript_16621/m.47865 type:complete len:159 (-) Transcript_16621:140-616(-)
MNSAPQQPRYVHGRQRRAGIEKLETGPSARHTRYRQNRRTHLRRRRGLTGGRPGSATNARRLMSFREDSAAAAPIFCGSERPIFIRAHDELPCPAAKLAPRMARLRKGKSDAKGPTLVYDLRGNGHPVFVVHWVEMQIQFKTPNAGNSGQHNARNTLW